MIKTVNSGSFVGDAALFLKASENPFLREDIYQTDAETIFDFLNIVLPIDTFNGVKELFNAINQPEVEKWLKPEDAAEFYNIRLSTTETLTQEEIDTVSQLLGWALKVTMCGEELSEPDTLYNGPNGCIIEYFYDPTKSCRSDYYHVEAFQKFNDIMIDGSDIRKTNRSGPKTKGTRLVDGLGYKIDFTIEVK